MDFLVIRTALPFGYLAAFSGLLALAVVGAVLAVGGTRRRKRWRLGAGLVLLAGVALIVAASIRADSIDWNPLLREERMLYGEWRMYGSVLTLQADGQYRCTRQACVELGTQGRWRRAGDFEVVFEGGVNRQITRRLAQDGQRLYLVAGTERVDPDMWRPRFTFSRQVRAT